LPWDGVVPGNRAVALQSEAPKNTTLKPRLTFPAPTQQSPAGAPPADVRATAWVIS
jgi:hypothetical protein